MRLIILIFFSIIFFSCNTINKDFLIQFKKVNSVEELNSFSDKKIPNVNLNILEKTNEVNSFVFNINTEYYFGNQYKLNDDFIILSYKKIYRPIYKPVFNMINWNDVFLCIYSLKKNEVVSKLKISSSDPMYSKYKYSSETFNIKSFYFSYRYNEENNSSIFVSDSIEERYKVVENRFVKID